MVLEANYSSLNRVQKPQDQTDSVEDKAAPQSLEECLETVVTWVTDRFGKNYFVEPLDDFLLRYGKVFPEDEFYQARMSYFLEHCILERPLSGAHHGRTPLALYIDEKCGANKAVTMDSQWRSLSAFRHGVFMVERAGEHQISLRDLLADKVLIVRARDEETLKYLHKKVIFQGFLFGVDNHYNLGQGLIIHPSRAYKSISKFLKSHRKSPQLRSDEILRVLASTNIRYLRMQHVDPQVIYQAISV